MSAGSPADVAAAVREHYSRTLRYADRGLVRRTSGANETTRFFETEFVRGSHLIFRVGKSQVWGHSTECFELRIDARGATGRYAVDACQPHTWPTPQLGVAATVGVSSLASTMVLPLLLGIDEPPSPFRVATGLALMPGPRLTLSGQTPSGSAVFTLSDDGQWLQKASLHRVDAGGIVLTQVSITVSEGTGGSAES